MWEQPSADSARHVFRGVADLEPGIETFCAADAIRNSMNQLKAARRYWHLMKFSSLGTTRKFDV